MIGQKIRIYPTKEQQIVLNQMFHFAKHAYNMMLDKWQKWYKQYKDGEVVEKPTQYKVRDWYKQNKEIEYANITNMIITSESDHLAQAFKRFFNKNARYPKFKKAKDSFTLDRTSKYICAIKDNKVKINKHLYIKMSENFKYKNPKKFTISKHFDEYYLSVCFDDNADIINTATNKSCGIDLGLKTNVVLYDSNGASLQYNQDKNKIKKFQKTISFYDKHLSRKSKGSKAYLKMLNKKRKRMSNQQNRNDDFYNKVVLNIVKSYDVIGIETLNVFGLKRNKHLSKSWNSATIGKFITKLHNKAKMYNKKIVEVGKTFPSSQLCCCCGRKQKMPLNKRTYMCECGMILDRDINAAKNILFEAIRLNEQTNIKER